MEKNESIKKISDRELMEILEQNPSKFVARGENTNEEQWGRGKNSVRQRDRLRQRARAGINTSRLAYDGTGRVLRDWKNHSLCTFQTGKRYNCDLSASYNIGARYFIRELLKHLPATERSLLEAKVPSVKRRTWKHVTLVM